MNCEVNIMTKGNEMYDDMLTHEQMFNEDSDDDQFQGFE